MAGGCALLQTTVQMSASSPSIRAQRDHGPAVRVLLRILETTVPDRAARERAIRGALVDAALTELPDSFDELLRFVRLHLPRFLADPDRPTLVQAVLEDFEAEAELARLGSDPNSSARMAVATRVPEPLVAKQIERSQMGREPKSEPRNIAPHQNVAFRERPAVLVVDDDRFKRAALARTLVQARCDVTVLDAADEAIEAIHGSDALDLLVIDVDAPGADAIISALVGARPGVPVLAWTFAAPAAAAHVTRILGVRACETVTRSALSNEVHRAVHRLLDRG